MSESGLGLGIDEKLAALELESHLRSMSGGSGRIGGSGGRAGVVRPPAAMDDMLYGSSDAASRGKHVF